MKYIYAYMSIVKFLCILEGMQRGCFRLTFLTAEMNPLKNRSEDESTYEDKYV